MTTINDCSKSIDTNNNNNNNNNNKLNNKTESLVFFDLNNNSESELDEQQNDILAISPNERWNKLSSELSNIQKLPYFDTINLAIDTERGFETAWNEIHIDKLISKLSSNVQTRSHDLIKSNLNKILSYLKELDHLNILTLYDYWWSESKCVVITELSTAGSLKKLLDNSRRSQTQVKASTYKRWLNQLLNAINYMYSKNISIFQGCLNTETIFIQNNSAIKIPPMLTSLLNATLLQQDKNVRDCFKYTNESLNRDLYSIGCIAIDIFKAHLTIDANVTQIASKLVNNRTYLRTCGFLGDDSQREFVYDCLNPDEQFTNAKDNQQKIDFLCCHSLINEIYSLKVLAVFNYTIYFHERHLETFIRSHTDQLAKNTDASSSNSSLGSNKDSDEKQLHDKATSYLVNSVNLPKNFFAILEDILSGIYPRLRNTRKTNDGINKFRKIPSNSQLKYLVTNTHHQDLTQKRLKKNSSAFVLEDDSSNSNIVFIISNEETNTSNVNNTTPTSPSKNLPTLGGEMRRIKWSSCNYSNQKLNLKVKFTDNLCRTLVCDLPFTSAANLDYLCMDLANELISYGLVNFNDKNLILKSLQTAFQK